MLGPVRFDHIEMCTREVCRTFRLKDDMATSVATLTSLDDILASLRAELASLSASKPPAEAEGSQAIAEGDAVAAVAAVPAKKPRPSYTALEESLDVTKARRLITARENSIRSTKMALEKARATQGT